MTLISTRAGQLVTGLFLAMTSYLPAATPLADFEDADSLTAWKWDARQSQLARSDRFATTGSYALKFTSPAWQKGLPEWPAFETRPVITNWSGYDRLVVDITNLKAEKFVFSLFVSDDKVPFRQGLSYRFDLPALGFHRFEAPLAGFPKTVNRSNIAILHFFTQRPVGDLALHLDNLVLLRPGETLPEPGPAFVGQVAELGQNGLRIGEELISQCRTAALALAKTPALRRSASDQLQQFEARLKQLRGDLASATLTLARLREINLELAALPHQAERTVSVIRLQNGCAAAGQPAERMLVAAATSMEKILPRTAAFSCQPAKNLELRLARNEKESFQLAVLPIGGPLRRVTVTISDLKSARGTALKRENIQCEVVGYVQTKHEPPYGTALAGWWPDPILNFLGPLDIASGDLQSFWVRVRAPRDQAPGIYRGKIIVSATGVKSVILDLAVRVYDFTLPTHSPLPVAITFSPHDHPQPETQADQTEWRKQADYPINAWKKHSLRWADFLADYYINYDSLYRHGPPNFEIIKRLHDRGQLVAFNLGIFDAVSRPAASSNALAALRQAYAQAKDLGILHHAYIYGFDECKPDQFPLLEQTAQRLRAEFPGALLMTTSYDHSYGMDTVVKTIDAWCPLTPSFKPELAAKARAIGKYVWWYICCGPHHPHANMFIEYPAIEGRLLMGAMTARQQPDGFLYYQISIWNSRQPITTGPFTTWDPRSWTTYHGDGAWTCVGPDGTPLPTIRLENFRDGLEDYAYVCILKECIRRREAGTITPAQQQWLAEAKEALTVPESLVKSMTEYSRDPARLYEWRARLGDLIDHSGIADANPWGTDFGVRGLLR